MQHIGDLQPFRRPDLFTEQAPVGRYSAKRSRWRFTVGSLEVGFDRASEQLQAETPQPSRNAQSESFGRRLMLIVGVICTTALTIALAGWLWSSNGPLASGETVSAAIVDMSQIKPSSAAIRSAPQTVLPTERPAAFLSAVIEEQKPAPLAAPAPRAKAQIAQGVTIAPKPAVEDSAAIASPDDAIVNSGNYLLIPSVDHALGLALRSGEPQNWQAGTYSGLIVVGDAVEKSGKTCRDGTVLLRDGSEQGRTQTFERCL